MSETKPVGYFCWVKSMRDTPIPVKLDAILFDGMTEIGRKSYEELILTKIDLDEHRWVLTLKELAAIYPWRKS